MNEVEITRRFETTAANTFRISLNPPLFVRGEGALLYTADNVAYTDLVGGSATSLLGHGHPAHRKAIMIALDIQKIIFCRDILVLTRINLNYF